MTVSERIKPNKVLSPLNLLFATILTIVEFLLNPRKMASLRVLTRDNLSHLWSNVFDGTLFAARGNELVHGQLILVYLHGDRNQVGPAQVAIWGVFDALAKRFGSWFLSFTQMFLYFIFIMTALIITSILSRYPFAQSGKSLNELMATPASGPLKSLAPIRKYLSLIIITIFTLISTPDIFYTGGHWFQVVVVGLWWWAGSVAYKRPILAGALIGVSFWFEPWGVLGALVLLIATSWRQRIISGIIAGAVGITAWIPFLLQPVFDLPNYKWDVIPGSLWSYFGIKQLSWSDRLIQSISIVVVALIAIYVSRKRFSPTWTAWAISILILLTRFTTDAFSEPYYWVPVELLLFSGAMILFSIAWKRATIFIFTFWLITLTVSSVPSFGLAALTLLLFLFAFFIPDRHLSYEGKNRKKDIKDNETAELP
jgi:hypothetical protein